MLRNTVKTELELDAPWTSIEHLPQFQYFNGILMLDSVLNSIRMYTVVCSCLLKYALDEYNITFKNQTHARPFFKTSYTNTQMGRYELVGLYESSADWS